MNSTQASAVSIKTTRFGTIEVDEDLIIYLSEGLIGFDDCRRYVVLHQTANSPIRWLQCLDDGAVAFPVMEPWIFRPDYAPSISDTDAQMLELTEETPKLVFTILTIPRSNPRAMTANLLGPLVINATTRKGKQVILADEQYTTRFNVLQGMSDAAGTAA